MVLVPSKHLPKTYQGPARWLTKGVSIARAPVASTSRRPESANRISRDDCFPILPNGNESSPVVRGGAGRDKERLVVPSRLPWKPGGFAARCPNRAWAAAR